MRAGLPVTSVSGGSLPKGGWFSRFSAAAARLTGRPLTFLLATLAIVIWGITGPIFHYSDTWQLVINTGTTIVTFLMVFLIQNTQNRESRIVNLKLDELLCAVRGARTSLVALDHLSDQDLESVQREFEAMRSRYAPLIDDDLAHIDNELRKRRDGAGGGSGEKSAA